MLFRSWDRVDFATGMISYVDPTRGVTAKRRAVVPMSETLRAELVAARERAISEHVIEYGGRRVASIKTGFRAATRRAGLAGVTPHVLRHTCATLLAMRGISLDQIADFLAADPATVARYYRKHQPDYLRPAAAALDDMSAAPAALTPRNMRPMRRRQ